MNRLLLAGLLLCASCGPRPANTPHVAMPPFAVPALTGAEAYREVEAFVAIGAKVPGTDGARRAADHIGTRLTALGLHPERDAFMDAVPGGTGRFVNITATLPGTRPGLVIVAAHWDTKAGIEGFAGANDSGSGVGLLLALAPVLKASTASRPAVMLAFLDGEECRVNYGPNDGLHGSRHLAAKLKASGMARHVQAFILLDMVGDKKLDIAVPRNGSPSLIARVFRAAEEGGVRGHVALAAGEVLDDHVPFLDAGMPAVDLIDFEYGSAPGLNDYWHTPADSLDKLSPASLEIAGQIVLRVLNGM